LIIPTNASVKNRTEMKISIIANFGEAARADNFQNRCPGLQITLGSQNLISGSAAKLFVSSAGRNKRSAGKTNLILVDTAFFPFLFWCLAG
jgi:hypothetical protein